MSVTETSPARDAKVPARYSRMLRQLLPTTSVGWRNIVTALIFIALAIVFQKYSDGTFLTSRNIDLLLQQATVTCVVAVGSGIIIIMGEIDLSTGSAVYLTGLVAAKADTTWGLPIVVTILVAVGAGIVLGMFQGACVTTLRVPSFIVTLAGMLVFRGIGQTWTQAATIAPVNASLVNLSEAFLPSLIGVLVTIGVAALVVGALGRRHVILRRGGDARVWRKTAGPLVGVLLAVGGLLWLSTGYLGLPAAILWIVGVGAVLTFVMSSTVFGRSAYLMGANRTAAFMSGIRLRRSIFIGFVIAGILYGVGGLLLTSWLDGSTSTSGTGLELDAIAAAVIGGISLRGGIGGVPGAIVGALLLSVIDNGMDLISTSTFAQQIVKGGILLGAVALDMLVRRRTLSRDL